MVQEILDAASFDENVQLRAHVSRAGLAIKYQYSYKMRLPTTQLKVKVTLSKRLGNTTFFHI